MKKKIFTIFILFIICSSNTINANAATKECSQHKNYTDKVVATIYRTKENHDFVSGYKLNSDGKLSPIYSTCEIKNYIEVHGIFCGECELMIDDYTQDLKIHSKCGK